MALLVASNGCMEEKFEDLVAKICCYVISDVIKTGLSAAGWCSFSVDPICICTHTNEHVLQLAHCGGCCMWW